MKKPHPIITIMKTALEFSMFFFFMLFVAAAAARTERAGCKIKETCSDNDGYCIMKTNSSECNGTLYNKGCKGRYCTCCIEGCKIKETCSDNDGYCIMKTNSSDCNGTLYNKGCKGRYCTCCIEDLTECIAKPHCYKRNGECLEGNWTTCTKTVDSSGCHGDDCACCRDGVCQPQDDCTNNNGYCFENNSNHKCNGNMTDAGCGSTSCSCCMEE